MSIVHSAAAADATRRLESARALARALTLESATRVSAGAPRQSNVPVKKSNSAP
jgi:hypothetical protein